MSNYKASPVDFETQISLVDKHLRKRAFQKYKPRGLFLEFYGILLLY